MFPFLSCAPTGSGFFDFQYSEPSAPSTVDLTSLGGADYHKVMWNDLYPGIRKNGGGNLITVTEYDPFNELTVDFEGKNITFTGTDGESPNGTFSDSIVARAVTFGGHLNPIGFELTAPASTQTRTFSIWVMIFSTVGLQNQGKLEVSIGDSSFSPYVQEFQINSGNDKYFKLDFTYSAASTTSLNVKFYSITTTTATRTVQYIASWLSNPV